jgi:hypothetical protein
VALTWSARDIPPTPPAAAPDDVAPGDRDAISVVQE